MISNTKISQVVFWISVVIIFIGFMENINELRYNLMIPLIAIGWVLHFTYSDHKIDSHSTKSFILLSGIVALIALPSLLKIYPHAHNLIRYTYYSFVVGLIVKLFSVYSTFVFLKGDINKLERMLKYVIILNLSMFSTVYCCFWHWVLYRSTKSNYWGTITVWCSDSSSCYWSNLPLYWIL